MVGGVLSQRSTPVSVHSPRRGNSTSMGIAVLTHGFKGITADRAHTFAVHQHVAISYPASEVMRKVLSAAAAHPHPAVRLNAAAMARAGLNGVPGMPRCCRRRYSSTAHEGQHVHPVSWKASPHIILTAPVAWVLGRQTCRPKTGLSCSATVTVLHLSALVGGAASPPLAL